MAYSGKFQPSYPRKYKGDPTNIIYRSLWERRFMVYCDLNENILEWGPKRLPCPTDLQSIIKFIDTFQTFILRSKNLVVKLKNILSRLNPRSKRSNHKSRRERQNLISMRFMSMLRTRQSGKQQKSFVKIACGSLKLLQKMIYFNKCQENL